MLYDKLYPYQQKAVKFSVSRRGAALFFEQGTGKTWITGGIIEYLLDPKFEGLVVVPLSNIETTWQQLIDRELPQLNVVRDWEIFKKTPKPRLLLIHYEAVSKLISRLHKRHWDLIVYDESQRLKGRGTKQSRAAKRFKGGEHRVILSGTPIEQAPQDLWAQFRFMNPKVFGIKWSRFEKEYLIKTGHMGYKRRFKSYKLPKFLSKIKPHSIRVYKEDVLNLPPLTFQKVPVRIWGNQRRIYNDLETDLITTTVKGSEVTSALKITQLIRLQQVCGGFVKTDKGEVERVGNAKVRKVKQLIKRLDRPVVIFCKYLEEINLIQSQVHGRIAIISGKTRESRSSIIGDFQKGRIDILICQVRSGGVGIDLYRSHNAIFYSCTFSYIDFDQAVCRLHRHGQTHPVKIFLIYVNSTIDETIYEAITSKKSTSELVLTTLQRRNQMASTKKATKKVTKKATKKVAPAKTEKDEAAEPTHKYGVNDLAELMGIQPASVRVRLRNAEIPKAGKAYGWDTKAELQDVMKEIGSGRKKAADEEEEGEED